MNLVIVPLGWSDTWKSPTAIPPTVPPKAVILSMLRYAEGFPYLIDQPTSKVNICTIFIHFRPQKKSPARLYCGGHAVECRVSANPRPTCRFVLFLYIFVRKRSRQLVCTAVAMLWNAVYRPIHVQRADLYYFYPFSPLLYILKIIFMLA